MSVTASETNMIQGDDNYTCEDPKYADLFHLAHNLKGYFDYDQALACAKAQGKPIFIDFTGHGCVNCREMEANVWSLSALQGSEQRTSALRQVTIRPLWLRAVLSPL